MSRVAQWPSHRAPSGGTQLHMWEAVSSSGVAQMQWPSHRAPSVGTQLQILDKAAVSLSLMAQSRLCLPQSPGTQHIKVEVSMSRVAQWPSHRVPSVGTQLFMCVLMLQNSHGPDGKIADELASTHDCTTAADAPVNYRMYVPQRTLKTSHRPDGIFTCFALLLAGRRCAHRRRWHGELLIVHHHGQHGSNCACSCSKVPIAPMGRLLTSLPRLTIAQLRPTLRSTTDCTCSRGP